jgi:hypothetical protein
VRASLPQLLAHGRWFSPGTPASSTTKTGRLDIAEILLKVLYRVQLALRGIRTNSVNGDRHRLYESTYHTITTAMVSNKTEHKLQNNICMHCTGMSDYFDSIFVLHFELSLRCFSSTVVMQLIADLCSTIAKECQAIHGSSDSCVKLLFPVI